MGRIDVSRCGARLRSGTALATLVIVALGCAATGCDRTQAPGLVRLVDRAGPEVVVESPLLDREPIGDLATEVV